MVLYVDTAFAVNALADALALYAAAALSGLRLSRRRLALVSAAGGLYGVLCLLPGWEALGSFFPRMAAGAALVGLAFGRHRQLPRLFLLFFLLSCTLAGALVSLPALWGRRGAWLVFFSAAAGFYALLGLIFRGSMRHRTAGEITGGRLCFQGRWVPFTALLDNGHTLSDPLTGAPVLTVRTPVLQPLWSEETSLVLAQLDSRGAPWCAQQLSARHPGVFRLLPYRTVGVEQGLLLCFTAGQAELNARPLGPVTVAVWPGQLGCGETFNALWGGTRPERRRADHAG